MTASLICDGVMFLATATEVCRENSLEPRLATGHCALYRTCTHAHAPNFDFDDFDAAQCLVEYRIDAEGAVLLSTDNHIIRGDRIWGVRLNGG